ncbi:DUF4236 domain-containing protein [Ralstonia pseudosolanacearum]|uniref:DUF4236 domain-containing protein n=1 Tax=Ralstonia pseudosolanacearum TaxID=1310165 RepID=UPI0002C09971|nr:DUF4236 domain-containing protein [Ralstonia pseudosolanacearum]AGH86293.1 hypothetical protein F504_3781 [Ralstonia pseudosolanacearum FQY_4]ANH34832.1 hypothetical protein A3768_4002 [Ralstonia solanacearum]ESS51784.1 hypothetical protein L665_04629 [Ralstonia solanacearum SD54]
MVPSELRKRDGIMGWSFRKSVKVAPGIRVNFSKSGISTSIGVKGLTYNTRGRVTASIPGTGIRFTQQLHSQRTSRPIGSVVAGSRRIDSANTERLSKREQATLDFVLMVQNRTSAALVRYFISHGVHVAADDLSDAVTLEEHQPFLETLSREFEVTTRAIRLALDIGSISLAEKEKAMPAVYEIERKCAEHQGKLGDLGVASTTLLSTVRTWPKPPALMAPLVVGLVGCFILAYSVPAGLLLAAAALVYGGYNAVTFTRRKEVIAAAIDNANQWFDSLLRVEITPRPALKVRNDFVPLKAVGAGAVILLAGAYALVVPSHQSNNQNGAPVRASADAPAAATAPAPTASRPDGTFSWLVGKYPSDVVNDRRFRAAFKGISRSDWAKISERLAVTNSAGIQSKDGYLVGAGCMAHACSSDQAAFVISEETGKGDFVLIETPGSSTSAIVRTYQWPGLPINKTPLANWAQQSGANIDNQVTAPPAPSQQTSFDCTKARSDAEHIICSDPELAASDVQLAVIYARAKAAATDPIAFKERTRAQWNYRERQCHDRECVARWYADQRVVLTEIANTGQATAP